MLSSRSTGFACIAATLVAFLASVNAFEGRPNILFIGVDDLRGNIGVYGDPIAVTPHIDRLAERGTRFSRAYVQQAVCAASRASLLTGCRPDTTTVDYPYNDFFREEFLPRHPSLPQYFTGWDYTVRVGGKIHHQGRELRGLDFEQKWRGPQKGWRGYALPRNQALDQGRNLVGPAWEAADVADTAYRDGRLAEAAAAAIRSHDPRGEPFFFAVGFYKPHLPFTAPQRYWDLYDREGFPLPDTRIRPDDVPPMANVSFEMPTYAGGQINLQNDQRLRLLTHGYYAATSFIDAAIGKLLDALDESGQADRTIIILWSDHGFHLGENASFGKHTCFEMAVRVPLIVVAPGFPAGQVCDALVEYVDLFPTLCQLSGVPAPGYLEGSSLIPFLRDPGRPGDAAAFSQYPRGKREGFSIRTDRYRYTEWRPRNNGRPLRDRIIARELYDHAEDPAESRNLAESHPEVAARLSAMLENHFGPPTEATE